MCVREKKRASKKKRKIVGTERRTEREREVRTGIKHKEYKPKFRFSCYKWACLESSKAFDINELMNAILINVHISSLSCLF